jgi:hypothetical protein
MVFLLFSLYARFRILMGCLTANTIMVLRNRPISSREQQIAFYGLIAAFVILMALGLLHLNVLALGSVNFYVQHLALNFLCAPPIAFLLFYVSRYDALFTRLMASKYLVLLGETSFSIRGPCDCFLGLPPRGTGFGDSIPLRASFSESCLPCSWLMPHTA